MRYLFFILLLPISAFFTGCGGHKLVSNLNDYEVLDPDTRYKIILEDEKGFELAVHIKSRDFYTEKRHLVAKAKNQFRLVSKMLCARKSRERKVIDNNSFINSVSLGAKTALVRNWIYYKNEGSQNETN